MILHFPGRGQDPLPDDDFHRSAYGEMSDEAILALRTKYKKFEKVIFEQSWQRASLSRYQETCAALCLALDLATTTRDKDVIYCPWFFEAFNTLSSQLFKVPKPIPEGKAFEDWANGVQETAQGVCSSFGCFGDYLVQYVNTVYPEGDSAPGEFIATVRRELDSFFKIGASDDKSRFVMAAFELLLGYDDKGWPKFNQEIYGRLAKGCLTLGWPHAATTPEDAPALVSNITNDELCELMGIKLPPPEERERIQKANREEMMRGDLERSEEKVEKFFAAEDWWRHADSEIGMWRITKVAVRIARKAIDFSGFYLNQSAAMPTVTLSEELSADDCDNLLPLFKIFTSTFCFRLEEMVKSEFDFRKLMDGAFCLDDALTSMLYFLDKLPHDRHLNAAKRAYTEWHDALIGIVRKEFRFENAIPTLRSAADQFAKELSAASDILNEREIQILDKQSFQSGEEKADVLAQRLAEKLGEQTLRAVVAGYSEEGRREAMKIVHDKKPERDFFSDTNLSRLFGTHVNTIANWRKGSVKPPEGFSEAFEKRDYKAMCACAEKYRANRECADAMNTKGVEHGISEEQMHRRQLK